MPEYYAATPLPIAIGTIEVRFSDPGLTPEHSPLTQSSTQAKITARAYPTLTTIESDVKRMVNNAKAYNENSSEIYMDAERIRKMTSNYMVKANPAYKDPNYVAFATPLPSVGGGGGIVLKTREVEVQKVTPVVEKKVIAPTSTATATRRSSSAGVKEKAEKEEEEDNGDEDEDGGEDGETYEGKTFQEAQELLIAQLIKYRDDE